MGSRSLRYFTDKLNYFTVFSVAQMNLDFRVPKYILSDKDIDM